LRAALALCVTIAAVCGVVVLVVAPLACALPRAGNGTSLLSVWEFGLWTGVIFSFGWPAAAAY